MCGIGGILRTDGQPIPEEWLDIIDARIAYRGPDGHGRFRDRVEIDDPNAPNGKRIVEVAFVHRRLSIIDHAGGHQPMVSERGRNDSEGLVAVVFNGCIYNHRELRKELEGKGHRFVTDHSDTEVLIHGWREWGEKLCEHLEGMYAFAFWDRSAASLMLARDLFGEKPLNLHYYPDCEAPRYLLFSSESDSASVTDRSVNADSRATFDDFIGKYLRAGYFPEGLRVTRHGSLTWAIHQGQAISWTPDGEHRLDFREPTAWRAARKSDRNDPATPERIEELLERAVARRLEADVPLGCFLSGGIDSSLVACFARKHKTDLMTFCVRMPDPRFDESHHAEKVAHRIGTNHRTLDIDPNPAEDLVQLINILGEPFGDSSLLPTYWVSKSARQYAKVALSGDGGDELFIGYERHMAAQFLVRHQSWLKFLPASALLRAHSKSVLNKVGRLGEMARDYPSIGIATMESIFTECDLMALLDHRHRGLPPEKPSAATALESLRQFDLSNYLPGDLLTKVDTASMACGLEVRCPFLDRDLARAALAMPIEQLMPNGQRKGLLRNIARKYLPKEIVDRPKMGFAIPIGEWFRTDYGQMKTLLLDHLDSAEPFGPISLNRKAVQRFIDEHMWGRRDHGQRLFTLLTLSIWARQVKTTQQA